VTLRGRLTLAAMTGVAVAVVLASGVTYLVARGQLRNQVDEALRARLRAVSYTVTPLGSIRIHFPDLPLGAAGGFVQLVDDQGHVTTESGETMSLPVDQDAEEVAAGHGRPFLEDARVAGTHVRVLTARIGPGLAVQLARPLDEVDKSLHRLGLILVAVGLGGIALAAALGLLVSRTAMAPVLRLTEATEHVTSTTDLSSRIEVEGDDELSRLASSFNAMLEALDRSMQSQRQLVADASHELRTPLTSVRTNIEVLARGGNLPPEERQRILQDAVGQIGRASCRERV